MSDETKVCPDCAEEVLGAAKVCKHCGYQFEPVHRRRVPTWAVILAFVAALVVGGALAKSSLDRSEKQGKDKADEFMCEEIDSSYCSMAGL